MDRRNFIELCGTALLAPSISWGASSIQSGLPMGMNLAPIADWEPGFPFHNLMWGARLWMTRSINSSTPWDTALIDRIPIDPNGYPLEIPFNIDGIDQPQTVFTVLPNVRAAGKYVLLHDGDGDIEGVVSTKVLKHEPGRLILEMKHQAGNPSNTSPHIEGIHIVRSKRGNHVRNIRILALDQERIDLERNPFLPEFIDFCRPFHALRFMDWMRTNGSFEEVWGNRKKLSFFTMVGLGGDIEGLVGKPVSSSDRLLSGGVAIELCIDLCNSLEADAWFNVPHRASADYIENFARMVKERLNPRLKVYCEFSNELWNRRFIQSRWALSNELTAQSISAMGLNPWLDIEKRIGDNLPERVGFLFRRCYSIWEKIFNGVDRKRLVTVCAVHHSSLSSATRTLKYCLKHGGVDALAPSGYFGPESAQHAHWRERGSGLTANDVLADMKFSLTNYSAKRTQNLATLARASGIDYLVYEGGQHIVPDKAQMQAYMPALAAAQQHEGMYDLYLKNFDLHRDANCKLFCGYHSIGRQGKKTGSWGHASYYKQPLSETPKLRAVLDANTFKQRTPKN